MEVMSVIAGTGRMNRVNPAVRGLPTNGTVRVNERVGMCSTVESRNSGEFLAAPKAIALPDRKDALGLQQSRKTTA
jgi:hypothetical protein